MIKSNHYWQKKISQILLILASSSLVGLLTFTVFVVTQPNWQAKMLKKSDKVSGQATPEDQKAILEALKMSFPDIKKKITITPYKVPSDEYVLSTEEKETMKQEMQKMNLGTPQELAAAQFIDNHRLLIAFGYDTESKDRIVGTAVVEYISSTKEFSILKQTPQVMSTFSYLEWRRLYDEFGNHEYSPISYIQGPMASLILQKETSDWTKIEFNPFMNGLMEEKPEENFVYFGLYKTHPAFFVSNSYLRKKYNLEDNQGIVRSMEFSEPKYIFFKELTNQLMSVKFPDPVVDISSVGWDSNALYYTLRIPYKDAQGKGLVDRKFSTTTDGPSNEKGVEWVYNSDGGLMQFEEE